MTAPLKRTLLSILVFIHGLFGNIQNTNAQTFPHDSMWTLLSYFQDSVKDEKIKQATRDVMSLYVSNAFDDSLAKKLLVLEDLLMKNEDVNQQEVISYASSLLRLIKQIFQSEEHSAYAKGLSNLALLYTNMEDYKKALPLQEQALAIQKKVLGDSDRDYAASLNNLAILYSYLSEYKKALPLQQQALAIRKTVLGEEDPEYTNNLDNLATLYRDMGVYEKALPLYLKELEIRKRVRGEENSDYTVNLDNLAILYEYMGKFDRALPLYQKDLEITKKISGEQHPEYASSLDNLGGLYWTMGEYEKALPFLKQALMIRKEKLGTEHPAYAYSLNNMGVLFKKMGQYEKALPLYEQALAIRKRIFGEYHPDYASTLNNLSALYYSIGQYEKALSLSQQGLKITRKILGEEHPDYATILNDIAQIYELMGQYQQALPLFQEALAIRKKILGEEHPDYASSLDNLAVLYEKLGQYRKSLQFFDNALAIRKKIFGEENPDYANTLNNLAEIYVSLQENYVAIPLLKRALAIRKKVFGEEHPDYAVSLHNLADLYEKMRQYEKAFPLYEQVLAITKKVLGEDHPRYAASLTSLANLYLHTGQYEKALPLYQQSLALRKKALGQQHPDYITSLNNLGLLYILTGNYKDGSTLLVDAGRLELKHLNRTYSTLSENEKITYLQKESSQFNYLPSIFLRQGITQSKIIEQIYANELVLKGMVLEDQQLVFNNIRDKKDTASLKLYTQWSFNKAFLGKQLLLPLSKRITYFDSLQEVTDQLEQQLSRSSTTFRTQQENQTLTATDISNKLVKGETAIEFIKFQLFNIKWTDSTIYAALLLSPGDSIPKFIPLFEERELQNWLQNSAVSQLYPANNNLSEFSYAKRRSLYNLVWKPLEKYLTGVNTVYYSPTGLLHRIAFNALSYDTSHVLIDKYKLNQVLSTCSVVLPTYTFQPSSISLWGNIQYDFPGNVSENQTYAMAKRGLDTTMSVFNFYTSDTRSLRGVSFSKLPGTKSEMDSINNICIDAGIQVANVSDTVATEEAFKALDGQSPQILHLATHGFFLPVKQSKSKREEITNSTDNAFSIQQNPMFRSGLVLAGANSTWKGENVSGRKEDGILTAYEIAQMDLSNTYLVVLSACKTALGDLKGNEGVIGLQRAFKMAGVKQMILSLWDVPDQQTVELMIMFYRNLINHESTKEALRNAQLKMKEKYPPYYWAAFVLVE